MNWFYRMFIHDAFVDKNKMHTANIQKYYQGTSINSVAVTVNIFTKNIVKNVLLICLKKNK